MPTARHGDARARWAHRAVALVALVLALTLAGGAAGGDARAELLRGHAEDVALAPPAQAAQAHPTAHTPRVLATVTHAGLLVIVLVFLAFSFAETVERRRFLWHARWCSRRGPPLVC